MGAESINRLIWQHIFLGDIDKAISITRKHRLEKPGCLSNIEGKGSAYLFDASLSSASGHQMNMVKAYESLMKQEGYTVSLYHAYTDSLFASPSNWNPYFLVPHHSLSFSAIKEQRDIEHINLYFQREYAHALSDNQPEVCIFLTARFNNIVGAVSSVVEKNYDKQPKLLFTIYEADDAPDCENPELIRQAFSLAASMLRQYKIPYLLSVETDYIRDYLISCGFHSNSIHKYEYVAAPSVTHIDALPRRSSGRVRVGYVGGTRPVKNPDLIAQMVAESNDVANLHWCVQFDLAYMHQVVGLEAVESIKQLHIDGVIELYDVGLDESEYRKLFCSLDFVVLPYSERYEKIGSGVLSEAIYAGVVPILQKNSRMEKLYSSLGGRAPTFKTLSKSELNKAIQSGVEMCVELKAEANSVRDSWQKHPSSSEQWRDTIKSWLST